jgi:TonB family protein
VGTASQAAVDKKISTAGTQRAFLLVGSSVTRRIFAMRFRLNRFAASAVAFTMFASGALAQSAATDEGKRKVKSKSAPAYPELARRMNVSGKVKIEVIVTPDGRVRSTRVIGGHPLLVQTCQDAVKEWKFFPAPEETTQIVEFDFHGIS